jgi:WD40 repeat protein/serine/threonine protein kinase
LSELAVTHEPTESFEDQPLSGEHTIEHVRQSLPATSEQLGRSARHSSSIEIPGYEFLKRLGKGGMGIVWLCKDVKAGRLVALKQSIRDELTANDRIRFTTEAQAMAKLNHPNIVSVYEVDEYDDRPYFTMEYCPGGALSDYLNRTPQPASVAAQIIEQLALGIQHAHENGIIHRDLKPGNVLVSSPLLGTPAEDDSGSSMLSEARQRLFQSVFSNNSVQLKLTDFGLAKNIDASQQMTRTQAVMGTPSYMAPEQASSARQAGASADIWSLGVMLYECITGSLPFVGAGQLELLDNIRSKDVVPPSEKVKCPKDLETICLKCLRKEPKDRYSSAQALANDVRAFQEERSISARPMSRLEKSSKWVKKNPSWAAMFAMFVVTLLSGTGVSLYYAERATKNAEVANQKTRDEQERSAELAKTVIDLEASRKVEKEEKEKTEESLAQNRLLLAESTFNGTGTAERANELIDAIPERFRGWEWGYLKRKYQGGYAILFGHTSSVTSVSFSPDGSRIASASFFDKTVKIWDARTGLSLLELEGHADLVTSVSFSPDCSQVASGSWDNNVRIWDAKSGRSLLELKGHIGRVTSVSFSPDGSRIASGSDDKTVRIWDAKTGVSMLELKGHTGRVSSVSFSPDGSRIASGSWDNTVTIWDTKSGRGVLDLKGHTQSVNSVSFSPDGNRIATGSDDKTVRIWDPKSSQSLLELKGHTGWVSSVSFSPDGSRIATGSGDNTVRIWDAKTGVSLLELKGHTDRVLSVSFSPDGSRIASASEDNTVGIWDAKSGQSMLELKGQTGRVLSVSFSPDGSRIASASEDNTVTIWDTKSGRGMLDLKGHTQSVNSVSFSPDGSRIASGSHDQSVRIWDAKSGQSLLELKGHTQSVNSVSFSPKGSRIASGADDKAARIWDAKTGMSLLELMGHRESVTSVSFSPDGNRIASGSHDQTVRIWDAKTGQSLLELKGHSSSVTSVSFSPDGSRIASASFDKTVRIWDAKSGQSLLELKGYTGWATSLSFSPDGSRIATGSDDKTVRIWDVKSGQSLLELKGHTDWVTSVSFSPDGSQIASASFDKTERIWESRPLPKPDERLTLEELTYRRAMSRPDPIWHREQLELAKKHNDTFAANVQNYFFHKATAEEHLEYNRWDEATWWFVAAAALKPKQPVIDWSVPKEKAK